MPIISGIFKHNIFEAGYVSTIMYNGSYSGKFLSAICTFYTPAVHKGPSYESPATTDGIHRATLSRTTHKNSPHS